MPEGPQRTARTARRYSPVIPVTDCPAGTRQVSDPYHGAANPSTPPFGLASAPFGLASAPFGLASAPFGLASAPFGLFPAYVRPGRVS
jgi:hypothetical protein